jgi:hypothetical protein
MILQIADVRKNETDRRKTNELKNIPFSGGNSSLFSELSTFKDSKNDTLHTSRVSQDPRYLKQCKRRTSIVYVGKSQT